MALQRKIASRNIKQGGILIKFQNQSSRVSQIGESLMDFRFLLKEFVVEGCISVPFIQRKITSRNIKQGGILIKFQNQSSRVFDFIVESVMCFIHIFFVCFRGVLDKKINKCPYYSKENCNKDNIKQGGILIKFQNQSSRVFDFRV